MEKKIKNIFNRFTATVFLELLIAILGFQIAKNYLKPDRQVIRSDGKGYYDYLPALFIYDGFEYRKNNIGGYNPSDYESLDVPYKSTTVNKYPCGTAIVLSPAFLIAHTYSYFKGIPQNGYTNPYQDAVLLSAIAFLAFGMFYNRKLLRIYGVKDYIIIPSQIIFILGSQLFYFTYVDGSFSHVYSFACISAFLYYLKRYALTEENKYLYSFSGLLGLITIIRPTNILIFLFVPFLFDSIKNCFLFFKKIILEKYIQLIISGVIFFSFILIQLILWYWQTGDFVVYSYNEEGFNFSEPHIIDSLFGFKKGLFIYTPLFLLALILFFITHIKKIYTWSSFLIAFIFLMFVTSSWHCWWYGMSFGLRPLIDFSALFLILFALGTHRLNWKINLPISLISIFIIYVQIIQAYQYKNFILHWENMDAEKYAKVFLHTEERYKGLVWTNKDVHQFENYKLIKSELIHKTINTSKTETDFYEDYILVLNQPLDSTSQYSKIGLQYRIKNYQEDNLKLLINVVDIKTNESYSYNFFHIFHHSNDKNNGEFQYVAQLNKVPANPCKIIIELYALRGAKNELIAFKSLNYFE